MFIVVVGTLVAGAVRLPAGAVLAELLEGTP